MYFCYILSLWLCISAIYCRFGYVFLLYTVALVMYFCYILSLWLCISAIYCVYFQIPCKLKYLFSATLNLTLSYMITMPTPRTGEQLVLNYTAIILWLYIISVFNFNSVFMVDRPRRGRLDLFPSTCWKMLLSEHL